MEERFALIISSLDAWQDGNTALILASVYNHTDVVALLLSYAEGIIDVNLGNKVG